MSKDWSDNGYHLFAISYLAQVKGKNVHHAVLTRKNSSANKYSHTSLNSDVWKEILREPLIVSSLHVFIQFHKPKQESYTSKTNDVNRP